MSKSERTKQLEATVDYLAASYECIARAVMACPVTLFDALRADSETVYAALQDARVRLADSVAHDQAVAS